MADYDEREEELSSITAIFPELVIDPDDGFTASIDLPVAPSAPLTVRFPAAPLPSPPNSDDGNEKQTYAAAVQALKDEHKLHHLPSLHLEVMLPEGYPAHVAPKVTLSTQPEWLPADKLRQLSQEVELLWEEFGRCQILFSYIDHLQQSAERAFDCDDGLDLPPSLKPELLDYDTKTKKEVFDAQTFDCGVCLEPKKGSECYRLQRCGHVFCRDCLQETCNTYIKEGDVVHVRCLDPTCGKEDTTPQGLLQRKGKADRTLHPRELLDIGIEEPVVRRYVEMKRKKKLEADKSTVYCPRSWCQAPARSAKYPPLPADLREYPESDSDDDPEDGTADQQANAPEKKLSTSADRLCICSNSNCTLAFCRICYSGWHGEFARCWPRNPLELSDEDKASYDYIRQHTSPCPTCSSPVQKTMGCNHMTCFQCQTHFCYLCGAWLDGSNPYMHFNRGGSDCYQRLWELEEGDEGQGNGFGGARMWEQEARRVAEEADRQEAERLQDQENERAVLMDAEGEEADDDFPLRLNGGQMMPEAPAPPAAGHIDPALAAQFARLQVQMPVEQRVAQNQQQQQQQPNPRRHQNQNQAEVFRGRGRGRGNPFRGGGLLREGAGAGRGRGRGGQGVNNQNHNARGGVRGGAHQNANANPPRANVNLQVQPQPQQQQQPQQALDEEAAAAAFRRFVELAARDQEEDWDSDELDDEDDARWEIRPRVERGERRR